MKIIRKLIDKTKPYHLVCDCGTSKKFYTLEGAKEWLPFAGKVAVIGKNRKVVIQKI